MKRDAIEMNYRGEEQSVIKLSEPIINTNLKKVSFLKLLIGLSLIALICALAIPVQKNSETKMQKILLAPTEKISFYEIADMVNSDKPNVDNKINGKIIQWQAEPLVVTKFPDYYMIVTKQTDGLPSALLIVYPQSSQQKEILDNIKINTTIKVKGKISGVLQGRIRINPAFLI